MTRFTSAAQLLAFLLLSVSSAVNGCDMTVTGSCTPANFKAKGCNMEDEEVKEACTRGAIQFISIYNETYQGDKNHMDGGGTLNNNGNDMSKSVQEFRINEFDKKVAPSYRVEWPLYEALEGYVKEFTPEGETTPAPYMSNFNITEDSCALRVAACCYTGARPGHDFTANSNMCHVDLHQTKRSQHTFYGQGYYKGNVEAYCIGFSWEGEDSTSNQFKGNMLYQASYKQFLDHGYVKNVPGAPMCGCIDQMPTMTNAECISVESVSGEAYKVNTATVDGTTEYSVEQASGGTVTLGNCGGKSLLEHYESISTNTDEEKAALKKHLLPSDETCDQSRIDFYNEFFLVPDGSSADPFVMIPNDDRWTKVAGNGLYFTPSKDYLDLAARDAAFRNLITTSENKIVYRHCPNCLPLYQHVYYKRITALPSDTENFLDYFLNNWKNTENVLNTDFEMYTNYEDAVSGVESAKWKYCKYGSNNVGFPNDCGPTSSDIRRKGCQWNNYNGDKNPCGGYYAPYTTAFYVDTSTTSST